MPAILQGKIHIYRPNQNSICFIFFGKVPYIAAKSEGYLLAAVGTSVDFIIFLVVLIHNSVFFPALGDSSVILHDFSFFGYRHRRNIYSLYNFPYIQSAGRCRILRSLCLARTSSKGNRTPVGMIFRNIEVPLGFVQFSLLFLFEKCCKGYHCFCIHKKPIRFA